MGPNCLQPFIFTLSSPSNNPLLLRPFSVHDLVVQVMTWRGWMVSWEMSVPEVAERRTARAIWSRQSIIRLQQLVPQSLLLLSSLFPFIHFIIILRRKHILLAPVLSLTPPSFLQLLSLNKLCQRWTWLTWWCQHIRTELERATICL